MKGLLLNENLPERFVATLSRSGLICEHVRQLGLGGSKDREIWRYANEHHLAVLTKDSDYIDLAVSESGGKVVLVTLGNVRTADLEQLLRAHAASIQEFLGSDERILIL